MVKSVYIHIPFCKNICSYCDFCKNYYNKEILNEYLKALEKEIKSNYNNEIIDTIYIGGGTPSNLSKNELNKLFDIIKIFNLSKYAEFTFECNYEDITKELLILLRNNKVNRLSIGVQTFNEKYSNFLERKINKEQIIKNICLTKKYFNNISIDLIYGFNDQSILELEDDLRTVINLDVKHVSAYCLIIEEHTKLYINKVKEENSDLQSKMYYKIINTLKKAGYKQYEISNFSKENYESKHNLTYWNNEEYYGFGAGASGFIRNVRYDNTKSIFNYIKGKTIISKDYMNKKDMIENEIMLNLRKIDGINKEYFFNKFKKNLNEMFDYKYLVDNKLLVEDSKNLYIPEDKLFVSNEIIIKMLDNLNYI